MRLVPSEWQTDESGNRFRWIGNNCKEYEKTIRIDGFEVPESEVEAFHKARSENKKKELGYAQKTTVPDVRICPFKRARNALTNSCKPDCPFYDNGCVFSGTTVKGTAGKFCPICDKCYEQCALYKGGCTLR